MVDSNGIKHVTCTTDTNEKHNIYNNLITHLIDTPPNQPKDAWDFGSHKNSLYAMWEQ